MINFLLFLCGVRPRHEHTPALLGRALQKIGAELLTIPFKFDLIIDLIKLYLRNHIMSQRTFDFHGTGGLWVTIENKIVAR